MASPSQSLRVTVNGRTQVIGPLEEDSRVLDFQQLLAEATSLAPSTLKLFLSGANRGVLRLEDVAGSTLAEAGIKLGSKVMVTGSSAAELDSIVHAHDLPGLAPLDHDLLRFRERAAAPYSAATVLPSGPYTFGRYQSWQQSGLSPPPPAALALLHRLASDPGIIAVMRKHRWEVGLLSEMPPEGKVGVSAMCILGYNVNAGQEISLRLRTDDLKGFRRYDRIRETLCHELAHMVHSEHDANFKALNSQLLKESAALDWTQGAGHTTAAAAAGPSEAPTAAGFSGPHARLMAATAASSGQTLAQLSSHDPITGASAASAAAGTQIPGMGHVDPTTAAAEAAVARLGGVQASEPSFSQKRQPSQPPQSHSVHSALEPNFQQPLSFGPSTGHCCGDCRHESLAGSAEVDSALSMEEDENSTIPTETSALSNISPAEQQTGPAAAAARGFLTTGLREIDTASGCLPDAGDAADHLQKPSAAAMEATHDTTAEISLGRTPVVTPDEARPMSASTHNAGPAAGSMTGNGSQVTPVSAANAGNWRIDPPTASPQAPTVDADAVSASAAHDHTAAADRATASKREADTNAAVIADDDEDPGAARYRRAEQAARDLVREAGGADGARAVATLATILQNVLDHPNEDRYRHIRLSNQAFMSRAGRFPASLQLLQIAGFSAVAQELCWQRNDPGLVWLSLAALRSTQAA